MNDAAPVGELQGLADLDGDAQNDSSLHGLARPNPPCQAALLEIGHHEVRALLPVLHVQDLDDVRVPEPLQVPCLPQETMHDLADRPATRAGPS